MKNTITSSSIVESSTLRAGILKRLRGSSLILAFVLGILALSPSTRAGSPETTIDQLRQRYQQARATFAKTRDYGKAYRESIASGRELLTALLNHWLTMPEDSEKAPVIRREIKTVYLEVAGRPLTERYNQGKSFMARTAWPLMAEKEPTPEQAVFMVELTKPQTGVRMNDRIAQGGMPTEPLGWNVQAAHALALIRAGKDKSARDEITLLHGKVSINHARNPKGRLDYGPEAGAWRYRNYIDYLQLCEVMRALQAAISNDRAAAKKHIETAKKLRQAFSPEAAPLVTEVERRIKSDKD